jgi:hypothetical protein
LGLIFSGGFGPSGLVILGGDFVVLQAPVFQGLSFDVLTFLEDLPPSSEEDIRQG